MTQAARGLMRAPEESLADVDGDRRLERVAWVLCAFAVLLGVAGTVMVGVGGAWRNFLAAGHADAPIDAVFSGFVGAVVVGHRPRNPVGWLLIANGIAWGAHVLGDRYGYYALVAGSAPGGDIATWLATPTGPSVP